MNLPSFVPAVPLNRTHPSLSHRHVSPFRRAVPAGPRLRRSPRIAPVAPPRMSVAPEVRPSAAASARAQPPFDWRNRWYAVLWEEDFDDSKPFAFNLWDRPLVLFRDAATRRFAALDDRCPHRAAPLSEGRVYVREEGDTVLECGYHGWTYACDGKCVRIPQVEAPGKDVTIPKEADMPRAYETVVKCGIVFVWFGEDDPDEEKLRLPKWFVEGHGGPKLVCWRNMTRILPYDFLTFQENVLDPAHVPFSHHGSGQGDRNKISATGFRSLAQGEDGAFVADLVGPSGASTKANTLYFAPPGLVYYEFGAEAPGMDPSFCLFTVSSPAGRGKTRALTCFVMPRPPPPVRFVLKNLPRWHQHTKGHLILDGDSMLLRGQERFLQVDRNDGFGGGWAEGYFCGNGTWDRCVIEWRKWIDENAESMPWETPPTAPTVGEAVLRESAIERFNSHTRDCKSCMGALRNMKVLRVVSAVVGTLSVFAVVSTIVSILTLQQRVPVQSFILTSAGATALVSLIVFLTCSHWIQMLLFSDVAHELATSD